MRAAFIKRKLPKIFNIEARCHHSSRWTVVGFARATCTKDGDLLVSCKQLYRAWALPALPRLTSVDALLIILPCRCVFQATDLGLWTSATKAFTTTSRRRAKDVNNAPLQPASERRHRLCDGVECARSRRRAADINMSTVLCKNVP